VVSAPQPEKTDGKDLMAVYRRTTIRQNTSIGTAEEPGENRQTHVMRSFLENFRTLRVYIMQARYVKVYPQDCFAYNKISVIASRSR